VHKICVCVLLQLVAVWIDVVLGFLLLRSDDGSARALGLVLTVWALLEDSPFARLFKLSKKHFLHQSCKRRVSSAPSWGAMGMCNHKHRAT
jgi:hypothetical protein